MIGLVKNLVAQGIWPLRPTVQTGITAAANSTPTAAFQFTRDINVVSTTTTTNNSALLPPVQGGGGSVLAFNADSTDALLVHASGGGKINNVATTAGSGFSVAAGKGALFIAIAKNEWLAFLTP